MRVRALWLLLGWLAPVAPPYGIASAAGAHPDLDRIEQRILNLEAEVDATREHLSRLQERAAGFDGQNQIIAATVRDIDASMVRKRQRLKDIQAQYQHSSSTAERDRALLTRQIRMHYLSTKRPFLRLLLSQDDPAALGRLLAYHGYYNRARIQAWDAALEELKRLLHFTAALETEARDLARLKADYSSALGRLEKEQAEDYRAVARARQTLQVKQTELDALRRDARELEQLVDTLASIPPPAAQVAFSSRKGQLSWPLTGEFQARFGSRRHAEAPAWRGVLIVGEPGSAVRSVAPGRVLFADWFHSWGALVIVDHGGGYMSLYGYNGSLNTTAGGWVEENQVIAVVGKGGPQRQPGLYFEIRHNGQPQDPERWCATPARRAGNSGS